MGEPFTVVDGGLSDALVALDVELDPQLWTAGALLGDPDVLIEAHASFVRAGAEVLVTASYQAGVEQLARATGDRSRALRALGSSTALARRAFERAAGPAVVAGGLVAASVGPYGALLADGSEYDGHYETSWREVRSAHRARLDVLAESAPDLVAVETIPTRVEAEIVLEELLRHEGLTAWVTFTCPDAERTWGGDAIEEAVALAASSPQVVAVGVNCTAPEHVAELLERGAGVTSLPLVAYPNHGRRWDAVAHDWVGDGGTVDWEAMVPRWVDLGARYIGGCCGVGPDQIRRLSALRDEMADDLR